LRTPVEGVYAMGDIAGRYMFTHAANFESEYLAKRIAESRDEPIDYGPMADRVRYLSPTGSARPYTGHENSGLAGQGSADG